MRFAGHAAQRMKVVLSCEYPSTPLRAVPLPTKQSSAGRIR
jgi:hypothetical protein